ncbi:hypothetical protein AB7333_00620 [Providencia rettgeri]
MKNNQKEYNFHKHIEPLCNNGVVSFFKQKKELVWTVLVVSFAISLFFYDWSWVITEKLKNNLPVIVTTISFCIAAFLAWFIVRSFMGKKYSLRIEKFSFGGLNILFNTTGILYTNSILNYLDTKRSLFIIREDYDNFAEVFDSYYQTYNFIRQEMRILDPSRDKALYDFTNELLMVINKFLTKNQNNYRRWYKHISETKEQLIVNTDENEKKKAYFYNMPIAEVQKLYYGYDNLINEFKIVNDFFTGNVKEKFNINIEKWDW